MKRKESVNFSIRMDAEVSAMLEKHCQESGQSKTVAVERAVRLYVSEYRKLMPAEQLGKKAD